MRRLSTRAYTDAATLGAAAAAIANLPSHTLPAAWIAAGIAPAALVAVSRGRTPRWARWPLGLGLQVGAAAWALHSAGPLDQPAALACTILPPLGFVAARREAADGALTLFLGFCVLLVGVILHGAHLPWLAAFLLTAATALRGMARLRAMQDVSPTIASAARDTHAPVRSGLITAAGCAALAFALYRALALLPTPNLHGGTAPSIDAAGGGAHQNGLDDRFHFANDGFLDVHAERLARVRGANVPPDLYLRSGYFDVPGLDAWTRAPFQVARADSSATPYVLAPGGQEPVAELEVVTEAAAHETLFVPVDTREIAGIDDLLADRARQYVRRARDHGGSSYRVTVPRRPRPSFDAMTDNALAESLGLLGLPPGFPRQRFEELLEAWGCQPSPFANALRYADCLARRCRYSREDPQGTSGHPLLDFLWGDERHGYCMHFASALAVVLRLAGVPCRIGVGLHGGAPDPTDRNARVFGSEHAHAWVEVPFQGRGWYVFDPTPPVQSATAAPEPREPVAATPPQRPSPPRGVVAAAHELTQRPWPWATVLACALLVAMWPVRRRKAPVSRTERAARPARRQLQQILRALAAAGHVRRTGVTLEQLERQLAPVLPGAVAAALGSAFRAYQEVRFGEQPLDPARTARLQAGLAGAKSLHRAPPAT